MRTRLFLSVLVLALGACDDDRPPVSGDAGPRVDAGEPRDAGPRPDTGPTPDAGGGSDAGGGGGVTSTLTITCDGELAGRVIVNYNTALQIAFTDPVSPFTSRGSISFDFPSGFSGPIANPEVVDGGPRHTLAITDRAFTTYGNHCWPTGTTLDATGEIEEWRPSEGVVRASFSNMPLNDCVSMTTACFLNGSIETTGIGVFD